MRLHARPTALTLVPMLLALVGPAACASRQTAGGGGGGTGGSLDASSGGGTGGGAPAGSGGRQGTGGLTVTATGGASGSGGGGGVEPEVGTGGAVAATGGRPGTGGTAGASDPASTGGGAAGGPASAGGGGNAGAGAAGGATGGAASPADAGSPGGATPDGGTTGCKGLFCEDFESGAIDPAVWDVKTNGGQPPPAVVSQAGMVGHGKFAAHFHANPNAVSYDFIITKKPPAALAGHHFGRAYFMITPMPPTNHTEYVYAGTVGFPQYKYLEVASAAPLAWQLTYVDLVPPANGEDYHSGGHVPTGRWFCLEWEFDDAPDQATVYVDGVADFSQKAFTFGGATTGLVGGFAAFGFGYYAWHPATYAFDVYYDDIVLDTKRVGCLD